MACNPKPLRKRKRHDRDLTEKQWEYTIAAMRKLSEAFLAFGRGVQSDYERKA